MQELHSAVYEAAYRHMEAAEEREEWAGLWHFLRDIKGHPLLSKLEGDTGASRAFGMVEMALWHYTESADLDPWEVHLGLTREDAEVEFLSLWDKILHVGNPWDVALERSQAGQPNTLSPKKRSAGWPSFVAFAAELQLALGPAVIKLPQVKTAEMLGVSQKTVSNYIRWATQEEGWRSFPAGLLPSPALNVGWGCSALRPISIRWKMWLAASQ